MAYFELLAQASQLGLDIQEKKMSTNIKGLYSDNVIWINRDLPNLVEKRCILAEEIGHYHTSAGNIIDQKDIRNRKQEKLARSWAYQYLVPLSKIVQAHHAGVSGRYEMAEFLDVTEDFLQEAINRYKEKYGMFVTYGRYTVYFDPVGVIESFD